MTGAIGAALRRIAQELDTLPARWALVGGFAVSARADPRFTRDVDVCVAVADDREAEHIVGRLTEAGYQLHTVVEQDAVGRLAAVRMTGDAGSGVVVDLLFASSGIEPEVVDAAEMLDLLPGLTTPVARAGHLVVLKLLARDDESRPQDAADLTALHPVLTERDRLDAATAAALLVARGYHRDRDIPALLEVYLSGR